MENKVLTPKCATDKYGIMQDGEVATSEFALNNTTKDEKKRFKETFRSYCSSFDNFLMNSESLIAERLRNEEISERSRLTLVNLVSAFGDLSNMQNFFIEEFGCEKESIDTAKEYKQIMILGALWDYIHKDGGAGGS